MESGSPFVPRNSLLQRTMSLSGRREMPGRPVSCRFCRSRKLRCSRETPCTNCVSRRITCEPPGETAARVHIASPPKGEIATTQPELLERIRKLEELVESQRSYSNGSAVEQAEESPGSCSTYALQTQTDQSTPELEHLNDDVTWLKSIYTAQSCPDNTIPNEIAFAVSPILSITRAESYITQSRSLPSTRLEPLRCVWLPQYAEARLLLQKFTDDVDHVHHIVHTPSLPAILDETYACLNQQGQVKPGNVLLLTAIFAISTHAWVHDDNARGLYPTWQEANAQAPLWVKAFEDMLDVFHRTSPIPIEGIQGISIATFALLTMEGFSRRCKSLFNMAFMLARELELHLLDQPSHAKSFNSAQTEIGRRVWWFLVAADWSLPSRRFNCGSQSIYHCHPRHMIVRKPLNINDEDLIDGIRCSERPLSQPTTMSFQLLQLRLSEISHNMVDRSPLGQAGGPSHDVVMDIDTELQMLLNDTPSFFSMSVAEVIANYSLDFSRASKIVHQGYIFHSLLYAQRCTIHITYFMRGLAEPAYAISSQTCLQSARQVIQTEIQLGKSMISATRYKFLGFLVPVFMASIVLLMDLCCNKTSSQHLTRREELDGAIRILQEAKHESAMAAKFLDSLICVLRKHEVSPVRKLVGQLSTSTNTGTPNVRMTGEAPLAISTPSLLAENDMTIADGAYPNGDDCLTYFDDLAQEFGQGIEIGSLDWKNMFSGIDSSMTWV